MPTNHNLIRVLIADDEAKIRDAYREVFEDPRLSSSRTMIQNLRAKVLGASQGDPSAKPDPSRRTRFELVFCDGAESAVAAATQACGASRPFAIVFLDMRMPPGPDGLAIRRPWPWPCDTFQVTYYCSAGFLFARRRRGTGGGMPNNLECLTITKECLPIAKYGWKCFFAGVKKGQDIREAGLGTSGFG